MSKFLEYLERYETKVKKSIMEDGVSKDKAGSKCCGKVGGKFSSPAQETKNPVKTNMNGQKPKGGTATPKTVKKVPQEIKNPVKTNMTGKKNPSSSGKFTNPSVEMGGGIKTGSPGKKPDGAGKVPKFAHASPAVEVKNPVKTNMTKQNEAIVTRAMSILDGMPDPVITMAVDSSVMNENKSSSAVASRASSLL